MAKQVIYIPQEIDSAGIEYLKEKGYDIKMGSSTEEDIMAKEIKGCDGIIIRVAKLGRKVLESEPNLKVVSRHGVGVDNIDLQACKQLNIRVTNGPYSNTNSVAEHTVAFMFALSRKLFSLDQMARNDQWKNRNQVRIMDMKGKTIGLVGSGRIALEVAKKCYYGLDMKVITYGTSHPERLPDYIEVTASLEELFERADIVSLHCPLNEKSKGLVNEAMLNKMKPSAYLINTARGEVIDEDALYKALQAKRIAGAALDVISGETIKMDNPLLSLDNVLFSPHCASHTNDGFANMALHAAIGIDEVLSGKEISWPVI